MAEKISPLDRFNAVWHTAISSPAVLEQRPDPSPPIHVVYSRSLVHINGTRMQGLVSLNEQIITSGGSSSSVDIHRSEKEIQVVFPTGGMIVLNSRELAPPQDASESLGRLEKLERAFEIEPTQV